jgi:L-threonylcarbamoyladenylate synthase
LGCDPYNANAVERLNQIKFRPQSKQFILLAGHFSQIEPLITANNEQVDLIKRTSEPTSWVADASPLAPLWLTSSENTLTIRISESDVVKKLCRRMGHAIISTSANLSGKKPAKNNIEIRKYFGDTLDSILATNKKLSPKPSKIIRLCDNHIIRD